MLNGESKYTEIWNETLKKVQESGSVNLDTFEMYFTGSKLYDLSNDSALVIAPAFINFSILTDYRSLIETCLEEVVGKYVQVNIIEQKDLSTIIQPQTTSYYSSFKSRELDPSFTFGNFVTGRSNAQAKVASETVANNPGLVYNPLFIYGSSGIGKTHLLTAIGNFIRGQYPQTKIGFVSGSDFVDYVYQASKEKKYDELKTSFKELDLLLVDDIQFIADKPKSHEIFFNIFNDLVSNRKQIVVTCDKSPEEVQGLEERLITRFNQGLTVNISAPEYETAVNIIKMKINNNLSISQQIDEDVISYIATNFSKDVRSLEGALTRLLFYSVNFSDDRDRISLKLATEAFKGQFSEANGSDLTINKIRKTVCDYYNFSKQQICSKTRTKKIANARHIAIYLCRKLLDVPYETIGNEFGKRDHATIMNSCERVESLIKSDPAFQKAVQELESKLQTAANN